MKVMTDQINNHTSIVIREIKEQTEKITISWMRRKQLNYVNKKELATSVKTRDATHRTVLLAGILITKETKKKTLRITPVLNAEKPDTEWLSAP